MNFNLLLKKLSDCSNATTNDNSSYVLPHNFAKLTHHTCISVTTADTAMANVPLLTTFTSRRNSSSVVRSTKKQLNLQHTCPTQLTEYARCGLTINILSIKVPNFGSISST